MIFLIKTVSNEPWDKFIQFSLSFLFVTKITLKYEIKITN